MRKDIIWAVVLSLVAVVSSFSCSGGSGGGGGGEGGGGKQPDYSDYTNIDTTSGFSTTYLTGKEFYWPKTAYNTNFIEIRQFTSSTVTWSDDLFNLSGTANYIIVNANGINGVIQYNDGAYDLFFNVQSVMSDHMMVCYTYQGIASVKACTIDQAYPWYFDSASAEASFP